LLIRHIALLRAAVRAVCRAHLFHIDAWWYCPIIRIASGRYPLTMLIILVVGGLSKSILPK